MIQALGKRVSELTDTCDQVDRDGVSDRTLKIFLVTARVLCHRRMYAFT